MGIEQLENKDREGKKRIIIVSRGQKPRNAYVDKTFENAPARTFENAPARTYRNAPKVIKEVVVPETMLDLYWLAYQKGFKDAKRKGECS